MGSEMCIRDSPVISLAKSGRWDVIPFFLRLCGVIRRINAYTLYTFLPTENLVGLGIKALFPRLRLVWSIRSSFVDLEQHDLMIRSAYRLQTLLHWLPQAVVVNSREGYDHAVRGGMKSDRLTVILNGVDTSRFRPDSGGREACRSLWNVKPNEVLIGLVARVDPMKGHEVFLKAAALSHASDRFRFVIVGRCDGDQGMRLRAENERLGLRDRMIWAGERLDMVPVYNALDVLVSASYGEGFSNVIAEAMACGTPCVVTDVGDSAILVGTTGRVVSPGDPEAMAAAVQQLLSDDMRSLGARARERITELFSVEVMVRRTEEILRK